MIIAMDKLFLCLGSILSGVSVVLGAFATHSLKAQLSESALEIFQTGARYQMYHGLALFGVGLLLRQVEPPQPLMVSTGIAFIVGILVFSGSLYSLSLTGIGWLGAITPLGGAAFILAWGCLAVATAKL